VVFKNIQPHKKNSSVLFWKYVNLNFIGNKSCSLGNKQAWNFDTLILHYIKVWIFFVEWIKIPIQIVNLNFMNV
jgi:hypothetical protein